MAPPPPHLEPARGLTLLRRSTGKGGWTPSSSGMEKRGRVQGWWLSAPPMYPQIRTKSFCSNPIAFVRRWCGDRAETEVPGTQEGPARRDARPLRGPLAMERGRACARKANVESPPHARMGSTGLHRPPPTGKGRSKHLPFPIASPANAYTRPSLPRLKEVRDRRVQGEEHAALLSSFHRVPFPGFSLL